MEPDPSKGGAGPPKPGLGVPFLFPFRVRSTSVLSSDEARSGARRDGVPSQADVLRDVHAAIQSLLEAKSSATEQRDMIRMLCDTLLRGPQELEGLLEPSIASPLVSSLAVLSSRLLRDTVPHEIQLAACELLVATFKYVQMASEACATAAPADTPAPALSSLDRSLLFRLVVQMHHDEDWTAPAIHDNTRGALETMVAQLSVLRTLTREGRDVLAYPGLVQTLTQWLGRVWGVSLMLHGSEQREPLAMSEHCTKVLLQLVTSVCKFSAARLEREHMELVLNCLSSMLIHPDIPATVALPVPVQRKEDKIDAGFSYYGLEETGAYFLTPKLQSTSVSTAPVPWKVSPRPRPPGEDAVPVSPPDEAMPVLPAEIARLTGKALDAILCFAFVPTTCIASMVYAICRITGLPVAHAKDADMVDVLRLRSVNTSSHLWSVLNNLLRSHVVHTMLRLVYQILVSKSRLPRSVRVGALLFVHATLIWSVHQRMEQAGMHTRGKAEEPAPLISLPVLQSMIRGAIGQGDDAMDLAVLLLIDDFLPARTPCPDAVLLPDLPPRQRQAPASLCILYGDDVSPYDWDVLPDLTTLMNRPLSRRRRHVATMDVPTMVLHMLVVILCGTPIHGENSHALITAPWAATAFWKLAPLLPDDVVLQMVQQHVQQDWYVPSHPDWLDHLTELVDTLYPRAQTEPDFDAPTPQSRLAAVQLVTEVYEMLQDIPSLRHPLVERVVVPLASRAIRTETNFEVGRQLRRIIRHAFLVAVLDPDANCQLASEQLLEAVTTPIFKIGSLDKHSTHPPQAQAQHSRQQSVGPRDTSLSAAMKVFVTRATRSTRDLVEMFHQLSFGTISPSDMMPEYAMSPAVQERARFMSLSIFRQLLQIVRAPSTSDGTSDAVVVPKHVRLYVLQWLLRFRADPQHCVFVVDGMEEETKSLMALLDRGDEAKDDEHARASSRRSDPADIAWGAHSATAAAAAAIERTGRAQERTARSSLERASSRPARPLHPTPWCIDAQDDSWPKSPWPSELWRVYCADIDHHTHDQDDDTDGPETPASTPLLPMSEYLGTLVHLLQNETEWDVVSCIVTQFPAQLSNRHLFCGPLATQQLHAMRDLLCAIVLEQRPVLRVQLPSEVRRSDLLAVTYATLKTMLSYQARFSRAEQDEIVEALTAGLTRSPTTAQPCMRALVVACHELPKSFSLHAATILVKLSTITSSIAMSVHILELLAEIASDPALYVNFTESDYRRVFGIALQYIQFHESTAAGGKRDDLRSNPARFSLSQYVLMLAYRSIEQWFLTLKLADRPKHASYITHGLVLANEGAAALSDHTMVCLDFLARFTYSQAEPKPTNSLLRLLVAPSDQDNAPPTGRTWLVGKGLITINMLPRHGTFEVIVRRPSGTMTFVSNLENLPVDPYTDEERVVNILSSALEHLRQEGPLAQPLLRAPPLTDFEQKEGLTGPREHDSSDTPKDAPAPVPASEGETPSAPSLGNESSTSLATNTSLPPASEETPASDKQRTRRVTVDPIYLALQMSSYPGKSLDTPPILLPEDRSTERLLRAVDLTPVYDLYKIGVLYVGYGQRTEAEILSNTYGSTAYMRFIARLGDLVALRNQKDIYTGGLDRQNDEHGKYAYVWKDTIQQIVFHTATLMPNHASDPRRASKKALIGNDWVHIVFNDSGLPYEFGTIPSQFNFVNIVIAPHSSIRDRTDYAVSDDMYFHVSLQRRTGLPDFSPVGEGCLVSFAALPRFVCNLAMQSDLMSQIYLDTGESMVPYSSNWVTRLHHVERFRTQFIERQTQEQGDAEAVSAYDFTQKLVG